jgi:alpha-amylase
MSRKTQTRKKPAIKTIAAKSLTTVPFEKGFHFYTNVGNYTGITATSLNEFAIKLQIIPPESITFHFRRKDFQNWIRYTINDAALAQRIGNAKPEQTAEDLRKQILQIMEAAR